MSTKSKSKGKGQAVCIRCPDNEADRDLAGHRDKLDKCQKDLPWAKVAGLKNINLWPGFQAGDDQTPDLSETPDFENKQDCIEIIATARETDPDGRPGAKFNGIPITKHMLEKAAKILYPPVDRKQAQRDKKSKAKQADPQPPPPLTPQEVDNTHAVPTDGIRDMTLQPPDPSLQPEGPSSTATHIPAALEAPSSSSQQPLKQVSQQQSGASPSSFAKVSQLDYVNTLANRIVDQRQASDQLSDEEKTSEVRDVIQKLGLRMAHTTASDKVQANYLRLSYNKLQIFVYSLEMVRAYNTNNSAVLVNKQWDRMEILNVVIGGQGPIAQALTASGTRNCWVSDGDLIWSTVELFDPSNAPAPELNVQYTNEMGTQLPVASVDISFNQTIPVTNRHVGELFYDETSPTYRDSVPGILTRGLNAFLTQHVRRAAGGQNPQVTITSANKSFRHSTHTPMLSDQRHDALETMNGYFLSVRPGNQAILINLSHSTSAFFRPVSVAQFIEKCIALGRSEKEVWSLLKGLRVRIMAQVSQNPQAVRTRFITNVGPHHIRQQLCNNLPNMTVLAWYQQNHGGFVTHRVFGSDPSAGDVPGLAINTGQDPSRFPNRQEWYAAEHLLIEEWSRFGGSLLPAETTAMIGQAQKKAGQHKKDLLSTYMKHNVRHVGGLDHFGFLQIANGQPQPALQPFGLRAGTTFLNVPCRFLDPPKIVYRDSETTPDAAKAKWDMRNAKFCEQGKVEQVFVLNISGQGLPKKFDGYLRDKFFEHGFTEDKSKISIVPARANLAGQPLSPSWELAFRNAVDRMSTQGLKPRSHHVLFVILQKGFDQYATVKRVLDTQRGIHSICVTPQALFAKADRKGGLTPQMASNLVLKYSIKSGLDAFKFDDKAFELLRASDSKSANTIVLGADVAHPAAGSHPGTPSVASVVGTRDDRFTKFGGSMRLQRGRKEDISELDDMMKERLIAWAQAHDDKLPEKILLYRDGVSESQYDIIRRKELPQIQNAMNEASRALQALAGKPPTGPKTLAVPQNLPTDPQELKAKLEEWADQVASQSGNVPFKMTFVIVGKRHNTRFYTTNSDQQVSPGNDNIRAGLVVDDEICHPFATDFYLQSHEPIQGTAKSAHYFVLQNTMGLTVDQLQSITNTFCFNYARTTRGVSYCAPAYYADRLCARGAAYIRHFLVNSNHINGTGAFVIDPNAPAPAADLSRIRVLPGPPASFANHEAYMEARASHIATDRNYFRGWIGQTQNAPALTRKNPWDPNLDNTMFWL